MNQQYGIPQILSQISNAKVEEIVRFLEDVMGVPDQYPLESVRIEDLTNNGVLRFGAARDLIEAWQKGYLL